MFLRSFILLCLAFTSCGRKQRTLFQFPEKVKIKISKLSLPSVRGLQVALSKKGAHLIWQPIDLKLIEKNAKIQLSFEGYHVYRSARGYFVPKKPITKKPIKKTCFVDASSVVQRKKYAYLVRGVFSCDQTIVQGPASQLVGYKK
jgi:hypothetical protein